MTVSNNQLVGLPTSIQKLNMLSWLSLNGNNLTELPAEIGDLKELRELSVRNNQLVGFVDRLGKLPSKEQQLSRTQHFILRAHAAIFIQYNTAHAEHR